MMERACTAGTPAVWRGGAPLTAPRPGGGPSTASPCCAGRSACAGVCGTRTGDVFGDQIAGSTCRQTRQCNGAAPVVTFRSETPACAYSLSKPDTSPVRPAPVPAAAPSRPAVGFPRRGVGRCGPNAYLASAAFPVGEAGVCPMTREEEPVVAPGGPRPRDSVHAVGSGQVVRRMPDGTYVVADEEQPRDREGGSAVADEYVLTPGGLRPKSRVYKIEVGYALDVADRRLRVMSPSGEVLAELGTLPQRPPGRPLMPRNVVHPLLAAGLKPAFGGGWITYASWSNNTGTPVSAFATTWTVPPAPSTQSGQTIFLFNGIQNSTAIYQPVLQWGSSAAGGCNYWAVASWYADGQGGQAFHSQLIQVNPGDTLVGVMTLSGQSGSSFSYNCQFQGIANSGLPIQNVQQLTWSVETLEAYGITRCSDYPDTDIITFRGINIQIGSSTPTLSWLPVNAVTDCGYRAIVASNSNQAGEVDLVSWIQVPSPAIVTSLTRYRDHIDLFVTGLCAMSRITVFLVQPGGMKRNIPGSSNLP